MVLVLFSYASAKLRNALPDLILSVPLSLLVSKDNPGPHFVQRSVRSRLEFLKKSAHLQTSLPHLEKVWKIKIKFAKMVKSLEIFLF